MGIMSLLIVSLGSALGALFRFWATTFINRQALSESFPWSTFLINMLACFLIGYLTSVITSPLTQILLTSGVLGGFSTFSTFANEVVTLFKQPNTKKLAVIYALASLLGGLLLAALGSQL
jgi:CrcB protein